MDLNTAGRRAQFLIRDRDGEFPPLFDVILADTARTALRMLTGFAVGCPCLTVAA